VRFVRVDSLPAYLYACACVGLHVLFYSRAGEGGREGEGERGRERQLQQFRPGRRKARGARHKGGQALLELTGRAGM
jgi:hypothetical protein